MLKRFLVVFAIFTVQSFLHANALQYFNYTTYQNPAAMQQTPESQLIGGVLATNFHDKFTGTVNGVKGRVTTNNTPVYPYFLLTHRFSCRVVGGLNVTQPTLVYFNWPIDGNQTPASITTIVRGYEVCPKLSFGFSDDFAFGVSFRYLDLYNVQISNTILGNYLEAFTGGIGVGGAAGLWYRINPRTFVDVSYFSPISVTLQGTSALGPFVTNNAKLASFKFSPTTFVGNVMHVFTDKFLMGAKLAYSWWRSDRYLAFQNIAAIGQLTVPLHWKNTWMALISARYQATEKFAVSGVAGFDESPASANYNILALPLGNIFYAGIGGEYRFAPTASIRLFLTQGRTWRPYFHNSPDVKPVPVFGTNQAIYSSADLSSTIAF